jgi:hypothetical protein
MNSLLHRVIEYKARLTPFAATIIIAALVLNGLTVAALALRTVPSAPSVVAYDVPAAYRVSADDQGTFIRVILVVPAETTEEEDAEVRRAIYTQTMTRGRGLHLFSCVWLSRADGVAICPYVWAFFPTDETKYARRK